MVPDHVLQAGATRPQAPGGGTFKVAFFEVEAWQERHLQEALHGQVEATCHSGTLNLGNARAFRGVDAVAVFIHSRIEAGILDALPRLRVVTTMSTGYDHIDLEACKARGIAVCNVPRYGTTTVAEHTFALILSLSRKVNEAVERTRRSDFHIEGLRGFDLYGKTLGVVGTGAIGLHVIRIARGMGMRVLAHDLHPNLLFGEVLGFTYVPLDRLLAECDVLTLHVPGGAGTRHLIDHDAVARMKRGALLINTARGSVVDNEALLWGLREGILAGAGLDVVEGEEHIGEEWETIRSPAAATAIRALLQTHVLLHQPNVVFTPHIAFNSTEALQRILNTTVGNLVAYLEGNPVNVVNP